jgi:predicted Ser/Thr protein kinase
VTTRGAQPAPAGGLPSRIGRYRIVDRLGKGTMGVVYIGEDEAIGRRVAIKVMMGDLQEEPEIRERFYREAKVTGQLAHRNIVTVFDLGEDKGHPYIVMELLPGSTLTDHLRTPAAASVDAKVDLMMQVCEGLQVAHSRGVIHRDMKPSNLFVQPDGALKILDFGVARLATSNLTLSGLLIGTPEYLSPEQAQGRRVDARSDLFSAAAVFYFMLTGRGPFSLPELPQVLRAVVHDDPPPLAEAQAPAALSRVVMKALAKAPADRYQQCADMLRDLQNVRRVAEGTTHRIGQAALERYRQVVTVINERRMLGRSIGIPGIDAACDRELVGLAGRFALFARQANHLTLTETIDREAASTALEALQIRHNAELAALDAMRTEAADTLRGPLDGSMDGSRSGLGTRAAALWRRIVATRGPS